MCVETIKVQFRKHFIWEVARCILISHDVCGNNFANVYVVVLLVTNVLDFFKDTNLMEYKTFF